MNRRHLLAAGATLAALGAVATYLTASSMGSPADYAAAMARLRAPLPTPALSLDLIRYATLAANGHNTQPWTFRVSPGEIEIRPDLARRTPVVDPDDHHLFVSLGCAAENLALAATARGQPGTLAFNPADGGSLAFSHGPGAATPSPLFDAIAARQSTRADYDGRPVPTADLNRLAAAAAEIPGVDLVLLTDQPRLSRLRDLVIAANTVQMADTLFLRELKSWLRFNPSQALRHADGLYSVASGNPALPGWLGPRFFDWFVTARTENDKYAGHIATAAGAAIFLTAQPGPAGWIAAGRACQRFALQATALGLKHAFLNQPVEVASFRPDLAALAGLPGRRPDIVMRFGTGPTLPYAPRRAAEAVIVA